MAKKTQKTVKMWISSQGDFAWAATLGGRWLVVFENYTTRARSVQAGNAWAKRMKLTPEWE